MATVIVLALSPQAMAQARKPACPSSSTAHPGRGAHACARSRRTPKSGHSGKAHVRRQGHHSRHAAGKKKQTATNKATSLPAASRTVAVCEDGSGPVRAGDGSFSCEDGSEAACENGASATIARDGTRLVCGVGSSGGSGSAEPACEAASPPAQESDGSVSCAEGSAGTCEGSSGATLASEGSAPQCGAASSNRSAD
jgi:hypothetical protein